MTHPDRLSALAAACGRRELAVVHQRGRVARSLRCLVTMVLVAGMLACAREEPPMPPDDLADLGNRYTAAWCSQDAASVAAFFEDDGVLTINEGEPSVGTAAITAAAQGFMTAFPDMVVAMDSLGRDGDRILYYWTLTGTNAGPGGTGQFVRISGREAWRLGANGRIADSQGSYDAAEYARQLVEGAPPAP